MTGTEVVEDRWCSDSGGVAAVAGALLGMVGNLIHPVTPIDDPAGVARVIADWGRGPRCITRSSSGTY